MELVPRRVVVDAGGEEHAATVGASGDVVAGPLDVRVDLGAGGWTWSLANGSGTALPVRSVTLVLEVAGHRGPLRMFRHGYQSWSPTGTAVLGRDVDPSTLADLPFLQGVHAADDRTVTWPGELRSEWVTLVADDSHAPLLAGFTGGDRHDGTFRLRPGDGTVELWVEAFLGGAVIPAGGHRPLHPVVLDGPDDPMRLLAGWADRVAAAGGARRAAPRPVGWCSWYHYFGDLSEDDVRSNLALADRVPGDLFQVDDGFQVEIGDWLVGNERFPSGVDGLVPLIRAAGRQPGLWLAPFLVSPASEVAAAHPEWLAGGPGSAADQPLLAWWNPAWGGGRDGFMYALDTTHPEVVAHLESLGSTLAGLGYGYLKLDFTFAPACSGRWSDPTRTPAERVRSGFDALRRGAGEGTVLVGCGVPLANVVGVVDTVRIGPDVAPCWSLDPADEIVRGYLGVQPATLHAYGNTVTRSFMHRRLWVNDPDCVMLRSERTALAPEAAATWAAVVGMSGGAAVVSDDLSLLDDAAVRLMAEVVEEGERSDEAARSGRTPQVDDLLDAAIPTTFRAAGVTRRIDTGTGATTVVVHGE